MIPIIIITFETNKTSIVLQRISNVSIDINVQAVKLATTTAPCHPMAPVEPPFSIVTFAKLWTL